MTNKKPKSQITKMAKWLDVLIMSLFTMGVVVIIMLFVYVLSHEYIQKP